jgi:hypothetical protein
VQSRNLDGATTKVSWCNQETWMVQLRSLDGAIKKLEWCNQEA